MTSAVIYDSEPNEDLTYICPSCNSSSMMYIRMAKLEDIYSWYCHECDEREKVPHLRVESQFYKIRI